MSKTSIIFSFVTLGIIAIGLLGGCQSDEDVERPPVEFSDPNEIKNVEILFEDSTAIEPKAAELLQSIGLCRISGKDSLGNVVVPCNNHYFHIEPLRKDGEVASGFTVLTKANTGGIALRRFLVFDREKSGRLVKVNGFIANLIGRRSNATPYDDLLLRFADNIDGSNYYYNCLFTWKDGKYEFVSVETIHQPDENWSGRVTAEHKDSVSRDIYQIILDNKMIF